MSTQVQNEIIKTEEAQARLISVIRVSANRAGPV